MVIFGKTGTITEGRPRVIRFYATLPANQLSFRRLLMLLGSAESNSEHPIGAAIVHFAKQVFIRYEIVKTSCSIQKTFCQNKFESVKKNSAITIKHNNFFQFLKTNLWAAVSNFHMFPGLGIVCQVSDLTSVINESLAKIEEEEWASSTVEFDRMPLPTNRGPIKQFGFKTISVNTVKNGIIFVSFAIDKCSLRLLKCLFCKIGVLIR
jgi:hypothetical protein